MQNYELNNSENVLMSIEQEFHVFSIHLGLMARYWQELLDYLNYDPTYIKLFVQAYNSQYDILEDLKQPKEFQYAKQKKFKKKYEKQFGNIELKIFGISNWYF